MSYTSCSLRCSEDVAKYIRPAIKKWKWQQECFIVLSLNCKNDVIGKPIIAAVGSVDGVTVQMRDIFREVIKRNATSIIVAHNHPSGDLMPSGADRDVTNRIKKSGEILGINFLDHVIVTEQNSYSFADHGIL